MRKNYYIVIHISFWSTTIIYVTAGAVYFIDGIYWHTAAHITEGEVTIFIITAVMDLVSFYDCMICHNYGTAL